MKNQSPRTGFIAIPRALLEEWLGIGNGPFSKAEAFLDLHRSARFSTSEATQEIKSKKITWCRGQLPAAQRYLADRWQWSKTKVDSFLKELVTRGEISIDNSQGISVITLCKYGDYTTAVKGEEKKDHEKSQRKSQQKDRQKDQRNPLPVRVSEDGQTTEKTNEKTTDQTTEKGEIERKDIKNNVYSASLYRNWSTEDFKTEIEKFSSTYGHELLFGDTEFFEYWSEPTDGEVPKMLFQKESSWDTERRIKRWKKNKETNFGRIQKQPTQSHAVCDYEEAIKRHSVNKSFAA